MAGASSASDKEIKDYFMAQYQEFTIDQGTDTTIELTLVDKNGAAKNLLGYSLAGKIKKTFSSDSASTTSFTTQVTSTQKERQPYLLPTLKLMRLKQEDMFTM